MLQNRLKLLLICFLFPLYAWGKLLSYGPYFKDILAHSELYLNPMILNYHSEKAHFLHGSSLFVSKDKSKLSCLGDVVKNCEIHLLTNSHGLNGDYKLPEVIIADVDAYIEKKINKKYSGESKNVQEQKREELKKKVYQELESMDHPSAFFEDGKIKAKITKDDIVRDHLNDLGIIKLGHFLNAIPGELVDLPRLKNWPKSKYIELPGRFVEIHDCINGTECDYEPSNSGFKIQITSMSYDKNYRFTKGASATGPSYLISPRKSSKIIGFNHSTKLSQRQWDPESTAISRQIIFNARSTYGNSGGMIAQFPGHIGGLRLTGILKGHNLYVNQSTAIHPGKVYELIEKVRDNKKEGINKCRSFEVQYKYDLESKSSYRVAGKLSEFLKDQILTSETQVNMSEYSENTGESGNNTGESGNNTGESGNNTGESGNNTGESGNNTGESGNNTGESGNNEENSEDSGEVSGLSATLSDKALSASGILALACKEEPELFSRVEIDKLTQQVKEVVKPMPGLSYENQATLGFWMKHKGKRIPIFANSEFFNLYCTSKIKFEPIENLNLKELFYAKNKTSKRKKFSKKLCDNTKTNCVEILKEKGSEILKIKHNKLSMNLDLNRLSHSDFQYWFGIKDQANTVQNLIDLRSLFFVDLKKLKVDGINSETTGNSIFKDSFKENPSTFESDRDVKNAILKQYEKSAEVSLSQVFQESSTSRPFQRILGESPIRLTTDEKK